MAGLADGRDTRYITYEPPHLLWVGLLVFCLKLAARRSIRHELDTPAVLANLCRLCGCGHLRPGDGRTAAVLGHRQTCQHVLGAMAGLCRSRIRAWL